MPTALIAEDEPLLREQLKMNPQTEAVSAT